MFNLTQEYFIFFSLFFVIMTVTLYAIDKWSIFYKSIFVLAFLLVFFSIFPYLDENNVNKLSPSVILNGFSNTSLIAVICLIVLGQGVVKTKVLDNFISQIINLFPNSPNFVFVISLIIVLTLSAFLNNTPVVIIFIPILQGLAQKTNQPASQFLMPLSFAAILGGMTTLIGSSTNLLVANSLYQLSDIKIGFFDFLIPGSVIALAGIFYLIIFSRFLLKNNKAMAKELIGESDKQFIAQVSIPESSNLIGKKIKSNIFPDLEKISILSIQRKEHAEIGPFEDFELQKDDLLVIATTREALSEIISKKIEVTISHRTSIDNQDEDELTEQVLTEAMITPPSSLVGQTIENISFRYRFDCIVIGLQRRSRMIRNRMTEIALETGDVLLIQGTKSAIKNLRDHSDIMPMEWASTEIIKRKLATKSLFIFLGVILMSVFDILPIVVASMLGVFGMLFFNILTIRQTLQSVDSNLLLLVVTSLALGTMIQETGTASYLSEVFFLLLKDSSPVMILSCFFIFVAVVTNFISNNACAILFTPIALDLASKVNIDPKIFAISLIFAVNTSFLTPLAYQTNLLVMGPGHYKFHDFLKFGLPLTIVSWITFTIFFPWYYKI